jgi:hypothetical protein
MVSGRDVGGRGFGDGRLVGSAVGGGDVRGDADEERI